jgi:hypothetical protein
MDAQKKILSAYQQVMANSGRRAAVFQEEIRGAVSGVDGAEDQ